MTTLKTFSETISTGDRDSFAKPAKITGAKIKRPKEVEDAIEYLRNVLRGKVSPEKVADKRKILTKYHKKIWSKEFLTRVKKTAIRDKEHKFINTILRTKYPSKKLLTNIEKLAKAKKTKEEIAKGILKTVKAENKSLMKSLTKTTVKKLLPKIVGLLGLGLIGFDLYKRIQGLLSKEAGEEFGEYYHRDVGWY